MAVHPVAPVARLARRVGGAGGAVSREVDAAPGVLVESVGRDDARLGLPVRPTTASAAQVNASFSTATVRHGRTADVRYDPHHVRVHGSAETAGVTRLLVQVAAGAEAVVTVDHTGTGMLRRRPWKSGWATTRGSRWCPSRTGMPERSTLPANGLRSAGTRPCGPSTQPWAETPSGSIRR